MCDKERLGKMKPAVILEGSTSNVLHTAVKNGDIEMVRELVEGPSAADVNVI